MAARARGKEASPPTLPVRRSSGQLENSVQEGTGFLLESTDVSSHVPVKHHDTRLLLRPQRAEPGFPGLEAVPITDTRLHGSGCTVTRQAE